MRLRALTCPFAEPINELRPLSPFPSDGTYDYEYDDEGNRIKKTAIATGDYVIYVWDYHNRLTRVEFWENNSPSADVLLKAVAYTYDVFGMRIGREVDADGDSSFDTSEWFVYDGNDILLVFDDSGSLTHRYLHGPAVDQIVAGENALGDVLWHLTDNQGTVRDMAEYDTGTGDTNVVNHIQYDSFGNILAVSNASIEVFYAYTGQEWDGAAEIYYYAARWYDPATGRFLSEDPIGFSAGDSNLTRYVGNNPTNFTDPTGLIGWGGTVEYSDQPPRYRPRPIPRPPSPPPWFFPYENNPSVQVDFRELWEFVRNLPRDVPWVDLSDQPKAGARRQPAHSAGRLWIVAKGSSRSSLPRRPPCVEDAPPRHYSN